MTQKLSSKDFTCLFTTFIIFAASIRYELYQPVTPQDEAQYLIYPQLILHGATQFKDFFSLYGPAAYEPLAILFKIFNPSVIIERLVGLLYEITFLVSLGIILKRRRDIFVVCVALTIPMLLWLANGLAASAWNGALAFSMLALCIYDASTHDLKNDKGLALFRTFSAGFFLGIAISFRIDFILPITLCLAYIFWQKRELTKIICSGLFIGLIPTIYVLFSAGVTNVFRCEFIDAYKLTKSGVYYLPLGSGRNPIAVDGTLLIVVGIIFYLLIKYFKSRKNLSTWSPLLPLILCFDIGIFQESLHRFDVNHIASIAIFVIPTIFAFPINIKSITLLSIFYITLCMPIAVPIYISSVGIKSLTIYPVKNSGRTIYVTNKEQSISLEQLIKVVNKVTISGNTLFVGPSDLIHAVFNDTYLYFMFPNLRPSGYFLEMQAGVPNASGSPLASQVLRADIIILTDSYSNWKIPEKSDNGSTLPNLEINQNFKKYGTYGEWTVLVKK